MQAYVSRECLYPEYGVIPGMDYRTRRVLRPALSRFGLCWVFRVACKQCNRVRNKMQNRFERLDGPARISWNVQDQAATQRSANCPTQRRHRSVFQSLAPHLLSESFEDPVADRTCGLRRHIAGGNPCAAGGYYQWCTGGSLTKSIGNLLHFIRNDHRSLDGETRFLETRNEIRTGKIFPTAFETGIANRNDDGLHICDSTFWDKCMKCARFGLKTMRQ